MREDEEKCGCRNETINLISLDNSSVPMRGGVAWNVGFDTTFIGLDYWALNI